MIMCVFLIMVLIYICLMTNYFELFIMCLYIIYITLVSVQVSAHFKLDHLFLLIFEKYSYIFVMNYHICNFQIFSPHFILSFT